MTATVASYDIEDDIRERLDDTDATDYEFTDTTLDRFIDKAVRRYSDLAPHKMTGTLTTVADEDLYVLPTGCILLTECRYRTTDVNEYGALDDYYPYTFSDWDYRALTQVRAILRHAYDNIGMGVWAQINYPHSWMACKYVMLYPAPSTGDEDIEIWYTTVHSKVSTDYPTIPSEHRDLIADLAVAHCLRRRAAQIEAGPPDYDVGQARLRYGDRATNLRNQAMTLEANVEAALSKPIIVRG